MSTPHPTAGQAAGCPVSGTPATTARLYGPGLDGDAMPALYEALRGDQPGRAGVRRSRHRRLAGPGPPRTAAADPRGTGLLARPAPVEPAARGPGAGRRADPADGRMAARAALRGRAAAPQDARRRLRCAGRDQRARAAPRGPVHRRGPDRRVRRAGRGRSRRGLRAHAADAGDRRAARAGRTVAGAGGRGGRPGVRHQRGGRRQPPDGSHPAGADRAEAAGEGRRHRLLAAAPPGAAHRRGGAAQPRGHVRRGQPDHGELDRHRATRPAVRPRSALLPQRRPSQRGRRARPRPVALPAHPELPRPLRHARHEVRRSGHPGRRHADPGPGGGQRGSGGPAGRRRPGGRQPLPSGVRCNCTPAPPRIRPA
ncbi:hypothetical protein SCALM49S_02081 [Streptomyces californicus]